MKGQKQLFSSAKTSKTSKDNWRTPAELFNWLNQLNGYNYDLAADDKNHLCEKYFSEQNNALTQPWNDVEVGWVNPPYSMIADFAKKIVEEMTRLDDLFVDILIPSRTDTRYFHSLLPLTYKIMLFKGRLKFINPDLPSYREDGNFKISSAPFPSCILRLDSKQPVLASPITLSTIHKTKYGFMETSW